MREDDLVPAVPAAWLPLAAAGLAAVMVGIGLGRFAYTPLLPAIIEADWFSEFDAVYLGAANLAGYLAGAVGARLVADRLGRRRTLRAMMALAAVSFIACMVPLSFTWYFVWRFAAGATGGILMVLAASAVLAHVPKARRGLAAGIVFTGVGLGIAASGTLVPALIDVGLAETWAVLGAVSIFVTALSWRIWPADEPKKAAGTPPVTGAFSPPLVSLYVVYALAAVSLVAHMVFLVDYAARGLGLGLHAGATIWIVFGAGAVAGPIAAGRLADALGFKTALRLALLILALAVALAVARDGSFFLYASSFVVGAGVPGIVPLIAGRAHQLSADDAPRQRAAWSHATVAFSIGQAGAAYAFSYAFELTGRYDILFQASAVAALIALMIDLMTPRHAHLEQESRP